MKSLAIGLVSVAAVATTILLVRQQKDVDTSLTRLIPVGQTQTAKLSLERIRELGL